MFNVGDRIAHPMHGAGVIDSIVTRHIDGADKKYYALQLPSADMLVMIPVESSEIIGVRPIIEPQESVRIISSIADIEVNMTQNWNKRYRENMLKIKSGDLMEVAEVIKGLMLRDTDRGLSTGERKMLHSAKQILISEIVLSKSSSYEEIEERINSAVS